MRNELLMNSIAIPAADSINYHSTDASTLTLTINKHNSDPTLVAPVFPATLVKVLQPAATQYMQ